MNGIFWIRFPTRPLKWQCPKAKSCSIQGCSYLTELFNSYESIYRFTLHTNKKIKLCGENSFHTNVKDYGHVPAAAFSKKTDLYVCVINALQENIFIISFDFMRTVVVVPTQ